jgi:hypothetical protein
MTTTRCTYSAQIIELQCGGWHWVDVRAESPAAAVSEAERAARRGGCPGQLQVRIYPEGTGCSYYAPLHEEVV